MSSSLAEQIDCILPQTQCTKCGYPDCSSYAIAIANKEANYNQCPPGGAEGIARIALLVQQPIIALNPQNGVERSLRVALIDEQHCIGCTLCIQACPVDAIMGANKQMHTVIPELCTGCDLCLEPCPVDCITMENVDRGSSPATGWAAWSSTQAESAKQRYQSRKQRLIREKQENEARLLAKAQEKLKLVEAELSQTQAELDEKDRKKRIIAEAIRKAALKQAT